jgi:hypothetical protein
MYKYFQMFVKRKQCVQFVADHVDLVIKILRNLQTRISQVKQCSMVCASLGYPGLKNVKHKLCFWYSSVIHSKPNLAARIVKRW